MLLVVILVLCILFIIASSTKFKLHPFLALLFACLGFGLFTGMPLPEIVQSINEGFGGTIGYIGIVIIAGTIIGTFLELSGGAFTLADRILKLIGEKRVPLAMSIIGYFVSIPVFADSGFVILSPLNRALSKRANISLAGPAIALSMGLMVTHCLIPPTPGPIATAGILGADIGLVILLGIPVSLFALFNSWLFSVKYAAKVQIDPNPEISDKDIESKIKEAPPAINAMGPILIPIILIILRSVSNLPENPIGEGVLKAVIGFVGEPVIALLIGVILAFGLPRKLQKSMLSDSGWVGKGIRNAAIIIIITGAGGAFGKVLQNSSLADTLGNALSDAKFGIWLPFIIAATIKTAQGSSTVAMITTACILSPLLSSLGFTSEIAKALVVLSIGAGAMVASHVNDSFFWVVTQMSRMDVKTGYRLHSLGSLILGLSSAIAIWILSLFLI
ncbi:MAG: GntP family permease [Bacteroidales bacterium]|nr:MAG: GntP family permease [Bacteroidales bacterium]